VLDRFFGVIPAIISGTVILFYLWFYMKAFGEPTNLQNVQQLNPGSFVPGIFVMVIITLVVALLVSSCNKYCKK
jgi:hypothetical protein